MKDIEEDEHIARVARNIAPSRDYNKSDIKHSILNWVFGANEEQVDRVLNSMKFPASTESKESGSSMK